MPFLMLIWFVCSIINTSCSALWECVTVYCVEAGWYSIQERTPTTVQFGRSSNCSHCCGKMEEVNLLNDVSMRLFAISASYSPSWGRAVGGNSIMCRGNNKAIQGNTLSMCCHFDCLFVQQICSKKLLSLKNLLHSWLVGKVRKCCSVDNIYGEKSIFDIFRQEDTLVLFLLNM